MIAEERFSRNAIDRPLLILYYFHKFLFKNQYAALVPFQEQRYDRVFNTRTRSRHFGLPKNLHPCGLYLFGKTLFLLNTNLFNALRNETKHTPAL